MSAEHADAIAKELHRRTTRLYELVATEAFTAASREVSESSTSVAEHVRGEVIGLRGALGILLGGTVPGGTADQLALAYYEQWLNRQEPDG
ncbi:hypothetical protein [Streptomyces sp. Wb2n-11]|uniref:hypothetical protein n=1 Tax=Streptomyces sp. Wb2n-11 TaxID=1030533 RepID=UPI000A448F1E|nr:hypothetical protein [Streptomyces sp. Wb2n-11]